ncbi:MAG: AAA family ATPase [Chloroflexi bacterium]|nr:AAA family ATPase [Chloroflexota bacterium]
MRELQIYLLGPPQIDYAGQAWPILRRQARALLYVLAVDKIGWTREQLCRLFWPDRPEVQAKRTCSHLLTHLRRALPDPKLLQTEENRVWLREDVWVDTVAVAQLARGKPEEWTAAVAMVRGKFLEGADLPATAEYEMWVLQERQRWEREELDLLQRLIEAEKEAGRTQNAIAYAQRYLRRDELAEAVHVRLMQLYAAEGDRSAALQQYEQCVAALERELGIDPSPATRAAYTAILQASAVPSPVPVLAWTTLPSLHVPHVERESLMTSLEQALAEAARGRGGFVFISGEAGIGKSRALQEFAETARRRATVLYGAATAALQPLPYEAITQALRGALDTSALAALAPIWLAELSPLLPELRHLYPALLSPHHPDDRQARPRLFEALSRAFGILASREKPLLLCLDDMHWADNATRDWLVYEGARLRHAALLVLLAYRSGHSAGMPTLGQRLTRYGGVRSFAVSGLSPAATVRLLQHAGLTWLSPEQSQRLWTVTGGNPFFVLEIARTLLERRPDHHTNVDDWPLPESVAQAIASRLVTLRSAAMQMLEASAILHNDFSFATVSTTAGRSELEAVEGLDELVGRHLLVFARGRYRFIHDLTRRVVLDRMSPMHRQLLHRRAGLALAQSHGAIVETIAQHFDAGGDPEKALIYYQQAAQRAASVYAWQTTESITQRMLTLLAEVDPECRQQTCRHQRCQILIARARMYYLQGRLSEREADLAALQGLATATGDQALLLEVLAVRARYFNLDGDYHAGLRAVAEGIALVDQESHPRLRSRLYAQKGFAHYFLGQPRSALQALQQATLAAGQLVEPATHGRIAQFTGYVYYHLAEYEQALVQHDQALRYHVAAGDQNRMAWDMTDMGIMCMQLLRLTEAEAYLQRALNLAREIGSQPAESYTLNNLGRLHTLRGEFSAAIRCHEVSLQLQRATGSKRGEASALIFAAQAYWKSGNSAEAGRLLDSAIGICRQIDYGIGLGEALNLQALTRASDLAQALTLARSALDTARRISAPHNEIKALLVLTRLTLMAGDSRQALAWALEAFAPATELGLSLEQALAQMWAGLACLAMGEREQALGYTQAGYDTLTAIDDAVAAGAWVTLAHSRALAAVGRRQQAAAALVAFRAAMLRQGNHITDAALRQAFWQRQRHMRRWTASLGTAQA